MTLLAALLQYLVSEVVSKNRKLASIFEYIQKIEFKKFQSLRYCYNYKKV